MFNSHFSEEARKLCHEKLPGTVVIIHFLAFSLAFVYEALASREQSEEWKQKNEICITKSFFLFIVTLYTQSFFKKKFCCRNKNCFEKILRKFSFESRRPIKLDCVASFEVLSGVEVSLHSPLSLSSRGSFPFSTSRLELNVFQLLAKASRSRTVKVSLLASFALDAHKLSFLSSAPFSFQFNCHVSLNARKKSDFSLHKLAFFSFDKLTFIA